MLSLIAFVLLFTQGFSDEYYLTDLTVVEGRNPVPPSGFIIIPTDLNEGAQGKYLYFAVKYGTASHEAIRDIIILTGKQRNIPTPISYRQIPTDLNAGSGGDFIYAAFSRELAKGYPLKDVTVLSCSSNDDSCYCYGADMHKIPTDLNKGAGGNYIYLCYQRTY